MFFENIRSLYNYISLYMNKGNKFIRQIMGAFEKDQSRKAESRSEIGYTSSSQVNPLFQSKTVEEEKKLVVRKKETNFVKRVYQLTPSLKNNHIFKLFGFLGINQKAIQNPDYNESLVYSYLDSRVIQRVEFYDYAVVIEVTQPTIPLYQPSVDYIIQKYMSKGETKFYELAVLIQELSQLLKLSHQKESPEQKSQSVKKWLDFLGDQMYVCSIGSRKFAISKSLLTYLQYELDQFAIEAIKYRANFTEFFSAINYTNHLKHLINSLKHIARFSLGQINLQEFKELTTYHFSDFIQSKNNVRSFCDMTITMLNPSYCCHKINFIYYKETEKKEKVPKSPEVLLAIQNEKERIRQGEYVTIKKIKTVPRHLLKQNRQLFANYKTVETVDFQEKQKQTND